MEPRNWVEYAFKQAKNELGWADFRVTDYKQIEKWWKIVMSTYLMISWQAQIREPTAPIEEMQACFSNKEVGFWILIEILNDFRGYIPVSSG